MSISVARRHRNGYSLLMTKNTTTRHLGERLELTRDCDLGKRGDQCAVAELDHSGRYVGMRLSFQDRDVWTGADYRYLRAAGPSSNDVDVMAARRRCDCDSKSGAWHATWCATLPAGYDPRGDR